MRELNDKDFDQAFRERISEEYPEFEEESWLKMEKKLRKKDRLVFYRNASIILLFLSFGLGFYFINLKDEVKVQIAASKPKKDKELAKDIPAPIVPTPATALEIAQANKLYKPLTPNTEHQTTLSPTINDPMITTANVLPLLSLAPIKIVQTQELSLAQLKPIKEIGQTFTSPLSTANTETKLAKELKIKRRIPISLAINVGPDFNSAEALVGGKGSLALGLSVGVGLTKKLSVQTGLMYGSKNYDAKGYDYAFSNPKTQASIAAINAACRVLEIPLKASYNIGENQKRSIELNAGLSSYLMLKENYVFKYTAAAARADRIIEKTNANQHFLSVIDLSATYNIKLKNKKLGFGIEPYIKIPLSGIGEGNMPLKSSGVSLKLRYDFNKKQ